MDIPLSDKKCIPCEAGTPPLSKDEVMLLLKELPEWAFFEKLNFIYRRYSFKNFKEALAFINKVGALAEEEGHHPDMNLTRYSHVQISLSTHAIGGVSENDFILAAKINLL